MKVILFLVLWSLWSIILYPQASKLITKSQSQSSKETTINQLIFKDVIQNDMPTLAQARDGKKRLDVLMEANPNPFDLGKALIDKLEVVYEFKESDPNSITSSSLFRNHKQDESLLKPEYELLAGQNYQLSIAMRYKEWYPVKGRWHVCYYVQKFSKDPDAIVPIDVKIKTDLTTLLHSNSISSSGTQGSKNIYTEMTTNGHIDIAEPGTWLLQTHFYPDNLLNKTIDGVHHSEIEVLRVRLKKEEAE